MKNKRQKTKTLYYPLVLVVLLGLISFAANAQDAVLAESMKKGKLIYETNCQACHMANGEGLAGIFPPLASADYLQDLPKTVESIVKGLTGEVTVNGIKYNGTMSAMPLSNKELADLLNYVYNNWGNEPKTLSAADIEIITSK